MLTLLLLLPFLATDTVPDNTHVEPVDTLRTVVVKGKKQDPMGDAIRGSLERQMGRQPKGMTVGDVLEKLSPGINDKITHPFAIKERKRERKHKRDKKILEEYDRVRTFEDLLNEAVARQRLEDEQERLRKQAEK